MVAWEIFGASEIGPGHIRAGLPNQDAFASKRTPRYDCMVVSDGVGSAAMSDVGSKMVCEAVFEAVESMSSENRTFDAALFVMEVKESFLRKIEPMTPQECSATCLFAINYAGNLSLGMLGDGLVAIQDVDLRRTRWKCHFLPSIFEDLRFRACGYCKMREMYLHSPKHAVRFD